MNTHILVVVCLSQSLVSVSLFWIRHIYDSFDNFPLFSAIFSDNDAFTAWCFPLLELKSSVSLRSLDAFLAAFAWLLIIITAALMMKVV